MIKNKSSILFLKNKTKQVLNSDPQMLYIYNSIVESEITLNSLLVDQETGRNGLHTIKGDVVNL